MELCRRAFANYWRTPSYVLAKLALNIFGGLLIGFTFWMADNTQQGTQNKVFVCCKASFTYVPDLHYFIRPTTSSVSWRESLADTLNNSPLTRVSSVPMSNQIHLPFLHFRSIWEIRERACRTYSWSALVASQIIVEIPWNFLGSAFFFFCSFWSVGLENRYLLFIIGI
jgi:ATP-binding cassette subfamily G (WHITE) protein 2 (SNQ2)